MKYKNTKTGAIIDSPFKIHGDNWVKHKPEVVAEKRTGESNDFEKYTEEEIDLEEMTKAELIELAKEQGIEVNERDTKAVIIETIAKAFE